MKNLEFKQKKTSEVLTRPNLSVAIITFNEERIIEKTLSAICDWVDEIVVVDSYSTDNTPNILEMFSVKTYKEKWQGYSKQKNSALSKCTGDWILSLDADEVVNSALKEEILKVIKKPGKNVGFKLARKLYIGTKWIRYGGYYPDYQLRLFKSTTSAHFNDREVHESVNLNGKVGYLRNPIEHYGYRDSKEYEKSLKKYAELASKEIKDKLFYLPWLRAAWAFGFRYIGRLGFLEGQLGLDLAKSYSKYVYKKYMFASKAHDSNV